MTKDQWLESRSELFERLKEWCGEFPHQGKLNVTEDWRRDYFTHTEIKLSYEGEPGERIPAYLLLPRNPIGSPTPAIFAAHQCGHHCDIGKEQVVGKCRDLPDEVYGLEDQAYGLELVREGFIVLAPDANRVGERFDPDLREQWQTVADLGDQHSCCASTGGSWGSIRWKPVFDVIRGIDFLCQCEQVDSDRIGMIGHSLGADTIIWTMPFEERIRAAAISGGGLMIEDGWLPYGLPYGDILRLIVPRPFFEFTGTQDYDVNWCRKEKPYNIDECMQKKRAMHDYARDIYSFYGKKNYLGYLEFDCGHSFPVQARKDVYAWLKRWLME